jgi:hypothetical protein
LDRLPPESSLISTNDVTEEINRLHGEIVEFGRVTLEKAFRIGQLLTEQKQSLPHGQFGNWIASNLPFSDRTARNYMRLHRERGRLKTETASDLGSAYRLLMDRTETASIPARCNGAKPINVDSLRTNCRLWWDYFAATVIEYHAHGVDPDEIAELTDRPIEDVIVILHPPDPEQVLPDGPIDRFQEYADMVRDAMYQWIWVAYINAAHRSEGEIREKLEAAAHRYYQIHQRLRKRSDLLDSEDSDVSDVHGRRLRWLIAGDHAGYIMRCRDPMPETIPTYEDVAGPWIEALMEVQADRVAND